MHRKPQFFYFFYSFTQLTQTPPLFNPQQVFNYLLGSLSRIFTTLQEVNDPLILYGFVAGFTLNLILAVQMLYYWNSPATATHAAELESVKEKEKRGKLVAAAKASGAGTGREEGVGAGTGTGTGSAAAAAQKSRGPTTRRRG